MQYVEPAAARDLPGLRVALTASFPAPYSLSARAVLDLRNVPFVPVAQYAAQANADLVAWTGHRNAPVAVYENEAPRSGWLDILNLAERLGSGPSLMPADISDRMKLVGFTNELIGENGFVWNMRIVMFGLGGAERAAQELSRNPMYAQYGYSESAHATALDRARSILQSFTEHVRAQHAAGSRYLVGDQFSALDVYWAYFSQLLRTIPDDMCPMPEGLRRSYDAGGAIIGDFDPILIEFRERALREHLELPVTF
jgi:glutathione S-transferase